MSAGGVFKIICNDGKADRMILATQLLNSRIKDIMVARKAAGKADFTPTLVDIERTHILYVNAHFKPYAAIGFEYNKVKPQSGSPALGNSILFSIPQFGDFFYDMVFHITLPSVQGTQVQFPTTVELIDQGDSSNPRLNPFIHYVRRALTGSNVVSNMTSQYGGKLLNGSSTDKQLHCAIKYDFVDPFGNVFEKDDSGLPRNQENIRNFVRYCEYPGNFLLRNVAFDVNGNPLDSYNTFASVMFEKYWVTTNKRTGYNRLIGQQVPIQGQGGLLSSSVIDPEYQQNLGLLGNQISPFERTVNNFSPNLLSNVPGTPSIQQPGKTVWTYLDPVEPKDIVNPKVYSGGQTDVSQSLLFFNNGPQTPKPVQSPLEMWIKLNFWFNNNVNLAVPSVAIPFGQRYINITLADTQSNSSGNLLFEVAGAYLKVTTIYDSDSPTTFAGTNFSPNTTEIKYYPWSSESSYLNSKTGETNIPGITFPELSVNQLVVRDAISAELYINNIFVNPEIHDIYIKRIGFSLIRVFRQQFSNINGSSLSDILLSQLKWPIEYMFIALQPNWNTNTTQNTNAWRDWHRMTKQINANPSATPLHNHHTELPSATPITGSQTSDVSRTQNSVTGDKYWLSVPTVDSLSLTSHGISIFDNFPSAFYNAYMPYNFGTLCMTTPEDLGVLFINFALFPGNYQPSGHINISRARETYVNPVSVYVSNTNGKVNFIAVAIAINFLLISDGSAVLRYST
jgi:hypothetical protein